MTKKKLAWYVVPGVLVASVTALGAVGTVIVKGATYISLPDRVEAGEQVNKRQDDSLSKLTAIQETWQNIYEQQTAHPPVTTWREEDDDGAWCCVASAYDDCWRNRLWQRCP